MSRSNGASKSKRQQAILGLRREGTPGEPGGDPERLAYMGIEATQSTISRDIEELGLARVHDAQGIRYVVPGDAGRTGRWRCSGTCSTSSPCRSCASDAGLIVRTSPGAAAALAEGIDRAGLDRGGRHDRRRQHDPDPRARRREAAGARAVADADHGGELMDVGTGGEVKREEGGARLQRRARHVGHDPVADRAGVRGARGRRRRRPARGLRRDRRTRSRGRRRERAGGRRGRSVRS